MRLYAVALLVSAGFFCVSCSAPPRRAAVLEGLAMLDHRVVNYDGGLSGKSTDIPRQWDEQHAPASNLVIRKLFEEYRDETDLDRRKRRRNEIGDIMRTTIKHYHEGTTNDIYEITAEVESMFDLVGFVASGVGGVTGSAFDKSIYHAINGGLAGFRSNLSSNILAQQTKYAVLLQVERLRIEKEKVVLDGMSRSDTEYPLSRMATDLYDYYTAGSLKEAVTALYESAEKDKKKALTEKTASELELKGQTTEANKLRNELKKE